VDSLKPTSGRWRLEHKALQMLLSDKVAGAAEVGIEAVREAAAGVEGVVDRTRRDKKVVHGSQVVHLALQ